MKTFIIPCIFFTSWALASHLDGAEPVVASIFLPVVYDPDLKQQYMSEFPDFIKACQDNFLFGTNAQRGEILVTSKDHFVYQVRIKLEIKNAGVATVIELPKMGDVSGMYPGGSVIISDDCIRLCESIKVISVKCAIK